METYTVSFFGHRRVDSPLDVEQKLEKLIKKLLTKYAYIEFLVGRDGEFDQLVSSAINRCKRELDLHNCAHVWVLPYATAALRDNEDAFREYYDEIEVCDTGSCGHFKAAHKMRNRAMVDRSHLVVFYVLRQQGGAWQTLQYARKQGIPFINLADNDAGFCR